MLGVMLNLDPERVRKALAENPHAEMVGVQRADGSSALLTRDVAEWLVSSAPAPNEADLDVLFAGATRARVVARASVWGEPTANSADETVYADVTDSSALAELRRALRMADSGGHMLTATSYALEVSGPEGLRASLGFLELSEFRWKGRWHTDAQLLEPWALGEWIAKHGSDEPLRREQEWAEKRRRKAEEDERRRQEWEAAMPAPLRAVWSRVVDQRARRSMQWDVDVSAALSALAPAAGDLNLLRHLFSWAGVCLYGPRSWCLEEMAAMQVIRAFASDDEIVECLTSESDPAVIAGVGRFLSWQHGRPGRPPHERAAQHAELVSRLESICPALRER